MERSKMEKNSVVKISIEERRDGEKVVRIIGRNIPTELINEIKKDFKLEIESIEEVKDEI